MVIALASVSVAVAQPNTSARGDATPGTCDNATLTHHLHRARTLLRDAYDLDRWADGPKRSSIRAAQSHRRCIEVRTTRRQISEYRDRQAAELAAYREMRELTPYPGGGSWWAIPWYVVACESGGSWGARNPSGASGPYQLMPGTYASVCRSCDWSKLDQHYAAGRVWDRSGGSEWVCA